jgi:hypothetical protein
VVSTQSTTRYMAEIFFFFFFFLNNALFALAIVLCLPGDAKKIRQKFSDANK